MTPLKELVRKIQSDQQKCSRLQVDDSLLINIWTSNAGPEQSTTGMNGQFVHLQLLIDCLLRMKSTSTRNEGLIALCKEEYRSNPIELRVIREFEEDYSPVRALWWYTRNSFLYRLLNRALRMQNIDLLYHFRFFLSDLREQLEEHRCSDSLRHYRGQLMSTDELRQLQASIGQMISINSFLSTSLDRNVAVLFLAESSPSDNTERILIEIISDPKLEGTKPFANITSFSCFPQEEEILMMPGSIFRLVNVNEQGDQIWIVQLVLCSDNDHELKLVVEQMKRNNGGAEKETNLFSLGTLLLNMAQYDQAEKYFHDYLDRLPHDHQDVPRCYHSLGVLMTKTDQLDLGLRWHEKSLEFMLRTLQSDDPRIANLYLDIGIVHRKKGDSKPALESFQTALRILQQAYGDDHLDVTKCLNSMGYVYVCMENFPDAIGSFRKALMINEKLLTPSHPFVGSCHSSLANGYRCIGNYDQARVHATLSLQILQKSLPPQHYGIAWALEILGRIHEDKKELTEALEFYDRAASIYQATLSPIHFYVTDIQKTIERVRRTH